MRRSRDRNCYDNRAFLAGFPMDSHAAPMTSTDRRALALFLLFALALLGAGIGLRDPWPSDEPRFALSAKQMVESGDWLFPHRGGELYADKPPMLMWMQAAAFEVVRDWRVAFLLPSLLAGLLTLTLTYDLARRLWSPSAGLHAATAMLFAFQFVFQFKRAQIDPLETMWITFANWGLLVHCLRGPDWRAYWLGCFAAGLGVITKGVGFLALLMLLPYAIGRTRGWRELAPAPDATPRWLLGALAFLAAIALWLAPMLLAAKARGTPEYNAYVNDILFHQTAQRYAGAWSHPQPFWYFVPVIALSWMPLSLAFVGAAKPIARACRERDARVLLPLAWSLLVVLFFSIARGKRDVYILPVLPMAALAVAPHIEAQLERRWVRASLFALALLIALACGGMGAAILAHAPAALRLLAQHSIDANAQGLGWMLASVGAAGLVALAVSGLRRAHLGLLGGLTALWLAWSLWAYPLLNDSNSARGIMRQAAAIAGPSDELALVGWKEQNLLFADRPVREFGFTTPFDRQFKQGVAWQALAPRKRWIFALDEAMGDCVDRARAVHVGRANRREWWMFRADAVKPGCAPLIKSDEQDPESGN
jgi:4-amino-4-deoxy-L-arabinose transferase-like glycosyltransferase